MRPFGRKCQAQVVMSLQHMRIDFKRLTKAGHCFIKPAHRAVDLAQIAMRGRIVRIQRDGLPNPLFREIVPAGLFGDDPKVVPCFMVVGFDTENLPVKCFGIREPPGLMVLQRQRQCLLSSHDGEELSRHQRRHIVR